MGAMGNARERDGGGHRAGCGGVGEGEGMGTRHQGTSGQGRQGEDGAGDLPAPSASDDRRVAHPDGDTVTGVPDGVRPRSSYRSVEMAREPVSSSMRCDTTSHTLPDPPVAGPATTTLCPDPATVGPDPVTVGPDPVTATSRQVGVLPVSSDGGADITIAGGSGDGASMRPSAAGDAITRDDAGETGLAPGIGGGRLVAPIAWQTVSPELDARMAILARLARAGDRDARDRLYALFAPRIARYAGRFSGDGWRLDPAWDSDDLLQEGYLVFIDLVASWPGGPSFAAYALGYLPWRLRNAVRRLNGPRPRAFPAPAVALAELADHSAEAAEAIVLLETVAAALPTPDGEVLLWRVRDGEAVGVIAARLGISRRTVSRSWHRTITTLRESLGEGRDDGREAEGA